MGPPSEPYASVIVPTHDRASTLPLAIRAIRQQTVPNIEIIIAGDGASDAVRAAAREQADADPRIVFHDFPKAPKRGGANRDRAVQMSKGARIFYSDDDDLLLPHHVETLGPLLDTCDAADSSSAFVSRSGRIQLALVSHARGAIRAALAAGTAKAVFDTHFAHRKSAYRKLGNPWNQDGTRIAMEFFQAFAAEPSIRWKTIPHVTALSFNGRTRQSMAADARRAELETWCRKIEDARWHDDASYEWHVFAFLRALGAAAPASLEEFLAASFMRVNGTPADGEADIAYAIAPARLAELQDLFALWRHEPVASAGLGGLAARLADPLIGWALPNSSGSVTALFKAALGDEALRAALSTIDQADAYASEMRAFLDASLLFSERRPREALRRIERLIDAGAVHAAAARIQAGSYCRKLGESENAIAWAVAAIAADPTLKSGYHLAVDLLMKAGRRDEARDTVAQGRALLPEHIAAALERSIDTATTQASPPGGLPQPPLPHSPGQ